jgi:hypothetical protein
VRTRCPYSLHLLCSAPTCKACKHCQLLAPPSLGSCQQNQAEMCTFANAMCVQIHTNTNTKYTCDTGQARNKLLAQVGASNKSRVHGTRCPAHKRAAAHLEAAASASSTTITVRSPSSTPYGRPHHPTRSMHTAAIAPSTIITVKHRAKRSCSVASVLWRACRSVIRAGNATQDCSNCSSYSRGIAHYILEKDARVRGFASTHACQVLA